MTGADADVDAYLEQWRKIAVNRMCEAFERVKKAEVESLGGKSYFYRKSHGLPPADRDDDQTPIQAQVGVVRCVLMALRIRSCAS